MQEGLFQGGTARQGAIPETCNAIARHDRVQRDRAAIIGGLLVFRPTRTQLWPLEVMGCSGRCKKTNDENPWAVLWDPNLLRAENAPIHIVTAIALETLNHGLEHLTMR